MRCHKKVWPERALLISGLLCLSSSLADPHLQHWLIVSPAANYPETRSRLSQAYQSLGFTPRYLMAPPLRSAALVSHGLVDAELLRADLATRQGGYIRVGPSLFLLSVSLWGRAPISAPAKASLTGQRVGVLRGVLASRHAAREAGQIVFADSAASLVGMLRAGRVDRVLLTNTHTLKTRRPDLLQGLSEINPQFAQYPVYHYIHPRHAALVAPLGAAMQRQGFPLPAPH